jgi:hypothetical protein
MSVRGLVVALLCGLLGLAGGAAVAYLVQPDPAYVRAASSPIPAQSPSVPGESTSPSRAPDIDYPRLEPGLTLPTEHWIGNDIASWLYHVPFGWTAVTVCSTVPCTEVAVPPRQINQQQQVRFRPTGEPANGGYSMRVKILENVDLNPTQMVATKVVGFRQEFSSQDFSVLRRTPDSVYFTFTDSLDRLRYNYFQWFAVPGNPNATLEMSVAGRTRDIAGLHWLFNRFADNVTGSQPPTHPPGRPGRPGQ